MYSTKVSIPNPGFQINYEQSILALGSCFAENIGNKLQSSYFSVLTNPFGVVFNPASVALTLRRLLAQQAFQPHDFFQHGSLWHSFSHSNLFSGTDLDVTVSQLNDAYEQSVAFLKQTNILMITFGTAWIYESEASGAVVANCHKLPAANFRRRRLSVAEIVADFSRLIEELHLQLPQIERFIFTVSPIRHMKDGLHESQISKSILLMAVEELQQRYANIAYFPAYEIQLDELRDYRYYSEDMLHPSTVAVDYIWQRFSEAYFSASTNLLKKRLEDFSSNLHHRPLHPNSVEHQRFVEQVEKERAALMLQYPFLTSRL